MCMCDDCVNVCRSVFVFVSVHECVDGYECERISMCVYERVYEQVYVCGYECVTM